MTKTKAPIAKQTVRHRVTKPSAAAGAAAAIAAIAPQLPGYWGLGATAVSALLGALAMGMKRV